VPRVVRLVSVTVALVLAGACGGGGGGEDEVDDVAVGDQSMLTTTTAAPSATPTPTDAPPATAAPSGGPARDPNQRYRASTTILESVEHGPQLCFGGVAESFPPQCGGPDLVGWSWDAVGDEESESGTTWTEATVVGTYDGRTFTLTEPPQAPQPLGDAGPQPDFAPACDAPDGDPSADSGSFRDPEDPDVAAVWVSSPDSGTSPQTIYNVIVRPGAAERVRALVRESYAGLLCVVERNQPTRAELQALQSRVHAEAGGSPLGGVFWSETFEQGGTVVVGCAIADAVSEAWVAEHWGPHVDLVGELEPV